MLSCPPAPCPRRVPAAAPSTPLWGPKSGYLRPPGASAARRGLGEGGGAQSGAERPRAAPVVGSCSSGGHWSPPKGARQAVNNSPAPSRACSLEMRGARITRRASREMQQEYLAPPSPPRCPPGSAQSPALGPTSASAHQSPPEHLGIAAPAGEEQNLACSAPKKHQKRIGGGLGATPLLVAPHRGGFGGWRCCCELSVCLRQQLPEPEQAPGVCFLLVDSFFLPEFQPSRASGLAAAPLVGAVSPSLLHAARGLLVLLGSSFTPLCLPQQPCPSPSLCSLLPVGVLCFPSHFSTSGLPRWHSRAGKSPFSRVQ